MYAKKYTTMKKQNGTSFYTYYLNRRCLHCNEPIADQAHKTRTHCPREVMPDGTIKCCKDDRHTEINSKKNPPYRAIAKHHKKMHDNIEKLYKDKGALVCQADINNYGIILNRPLEFQRANGQYTFCFTGYKIKQLDQNNFKIEAYV